MKTLTAFLMHTGVSALQFLVATPIINPTIHWSPFGNAAIQLISQGALLSVQAYISHRNSNTDPKGREMIESVDGTFKTKKAEPPL